MAEQTFRALILTEVDGGVRAALGEARDADLPEGEVTVAVEYSDVNYKDGLVLTGQGRLVKRYPHVGGIDFAGTVERSLSPAFRPGDPVILTGWRVGELRWGGYAARARVPADWLVPLPAGLTARRAMALGTAGFTAMLALMALEHHGLRPAAGDVLVTGAAGGVGSVATALFAARGYRVVAATGRPMLADYLKGLGAAEILDRAEAAAPPRGPLGSERWAACVDSVGGATLAAALAATKLRGACAAVGLAGGHELHTSVMPFILRGLSLLGIDSSVSPPAERQEAWRRLAAEMPMAALDAMTAEIGLAQVPEAGRRILAGAVRGRTVVDVRA